MPLLLFRDVHRFPCPSEDEISSDASHVGGQDVSVGFWLQPVTHQKAERLKRRALLRGAAPREDEACRLPSQDQERGALQVHMSKRGQKGLMYSLHSLHSLYSLPLRAWEAAWEVVGQVRLGGSQGAEQ